MSLDIYLHAHPLDEDHECDDQLYWSNITHNLMPMWREAGVYLALYQSHGEQAKTLIVPLQDGVQRMKEHPDHYRGFDSPNGWGLYRNALPFLEKLLEACERHPNAFVRVSR